MGERWNELISYKASNNDGSAWISDHDKIACRHYMPLIAFSTKQIFLTSSNFNEIQVLVPKTHSTAIYSLKFCSLVISKLFIEPPVKLSSTEQLLGYFSHVSG